MANITNKIIRGTFGYLWFDGELLSNVKSFEAKATLNYEEVNLSGDFATHQRYMGYSGEGTLTTYKVDSRVLKKYFEAIKSGVMPELTMIGKVEDPDSKGSERVAFKEVTPDEVTLMKFENNTVTEEEVPFKFANFEVLDTI